MLSRGVHSEVARSGKGAKGAAVGWHFVEDETPLERRQIEILQKGVEFNCQTSTGRKQLEEARLDTVDYLGRM